MIAGLDVTEITTFCWSSNKCSFSTDMYGCIFNSLSLGYNFCNDFSSKVDRLCGLLVSVEDYKHRGPGFDSRALLRIFLRELGPLSLVIG
jgi:hypothetical protein